MTTMNFTPDERVAEVRTDHGAFLKDAALDRVGATASSVGDAKSLMMPMETRSLVAPPSVHDDRAKDGSLNGENLSEEEHANRFRLHCRELAASFEKIGRQVITIARKLAEAKKHYEAMTGTGHGKGKHAGIPSFVEAVARETSLDKSMISRFVRVAKLNIDQADALADIPGVGNHLTLLLRLVHGDVGDETRANAVAAAKVGGRAALEEVLDTVLPAKDGRTGEAAPRPKKTRLSAAQSRQSAHPTEKRICVQSGADETIDIGGLTLLIRVLSFNANDGAEILVRLGQ